MKKKLKNKQKNTKNKQKTKKNKGIKSALSLFYVINAVLTGIFLLYLGVTSAAQYTRRNIDGNFPELIFFDDVFDDIIDLAKSYVIK